MRLGPFSGAPSADEGAFKRLQLSLNPAWIEAALEATGTATLRKRRLPADQVLWLVLGMAMYRFRPIDDLVRSLDLVLPDTGPVSMARSAIAQARARLGAEPLKWLFERCAQKWAHESARKNAWRGLAVYGVDGTTARVPDSAVNRAHFGEGRCGRDDGSSGYPLTRIVTLMALRSHLLADVRFGPFASELSYAEDIWPLVPNESLVVVDRNFLSAKVLIPLARDGKNRHWLTRARTDTHWTVVRKLGRGDDLIQRPVHDAARAADTSLPREWVMRAIKYQRPGFRPQTLLTSLLDPNAHPASEIIALYHERWELEIGYDEVKTDLLDRQEAIRSRTPKGVAQELWGIALVYNLVRLEMERVADEADVQPTRISFVMALRLIRDEWMWSAATGSPGAIPQHLRRLREDIKRFVLPPRRQRSCPRAVKIKMSSYPRKRAAKSRTVAAK